MNSTITKICYIILFLCFIAIITLIVLLAKCKSTSHFKNIAPMCGYTETDIDKKDSCVKEKYKGFDNSTVDLPDRPDLELLEKKHQYHVDLKDKEKRNRKGRVFDDTEAYPRDVVSRKYPRRGRRL